MTQHAALNERFDVVIVGARCAGASLAARLAKAGCRTLLLDSDALPGDMLMSTHYVQPPGVAALDELGIGERARAAAPASRLIRAQMDDEGFTAQLPAGRIGLCIRRMKLDAWLQEAAVAAGAELRDRSKVTELLRDGERVTGVVVQGSSGSYRVNAGVLVGADGQHSTVARLTGVEHYLDYDGTRGGYWFYLPRPKVWDSSAFPYDALVRYRGQDMVYVFQCDDDLLLIAVVPPQADARSWGSQYRERFLQSLRGDAMLAPLVEDDTLLGKGMGLLKARFFYRRAVGPGFALVGDAGHFKDFMTGHGITDALLSSRELARAIVDGRPEAMQWYWCHRDATTLPLFQDAKFQGEVGANNPLNRLIFRKFGQDPTLAQRLGEVMDRRRQPQDMIEFPRLLRWVGGAVLRGRMDVLPSFKQAGARGQRDAAELAKRRALLDAAERKLGGEPKPLPTASPSL